MTRDRQGWGSEAASCQHAVQDASRRLKRHVERVIEQAQIPGYLEHWRGYGHMGATLTDAILQSGLNYRYVVAPRVHAIINAWPDATTVISFLWNCGHHSLRDAIDWSHDEKPDRMRRLAVRLLEQDVNTEDDLRHFLQSPDARARLLSIRGVGPKTADYLRTLVGLPAVPIDRHLERFAAHVNVHVSHRTLQAALMHLAGELGIDPRRLDRALWAHQSDVAARRSFPA
jgi:hypothetical protein